MQLDEYERYGRQMVVPGVGLEGQLALRDSKVLVVGAGGLGCPAIAYLAGAGVGTLGIVDPDHVETSNLHRQILHHRPGQPKAESARDFVARLNPNVKTLLWTTALTPANGLDIVGQFDVVLDCTDSPMSRYLVNDAAVLCGKPLVSASALKTEGQLAVYNYGPDGPCYRCMFPTPPPPELVGSCSDNGIVGPVVGIMGVQQAIETIKVILKKDVVPSLTIMSMFSFPQWRQMRIRKRKPDCALCGDAPTIRSLDTYDYSAFCGLTKLNNYVCRRIEADELEHRLRDDPAQHTLVDVRPAIQYEICSLPGSTNWPISAARSARSAADVPFDTAKPITVICRHGNDSQEVAAKLSAWGLEACDVAGGLNSWRRVHPEFPRY